MINSINNGATKHNKPHAPQVGFFRQINRFFFIKKKNSNSIKNPRQPGQKKKFDKVARAAAIEKKAKEDRQAERIRKEKENKYLVLDPITEKRRRLAKDKHMLIARNKVMADRKEKAKEDLRIARKNRREATMKARALTDKLRAEGYPFVSRWEYFLSRMKAKRFLVLAKVNNRRLPPYWYSGNLWSTKSTYEAEIMVRRQMGKESVPALFTNLRQLTMWKGDVDTILNVLQFSGAFFIKNKTNGNHFRNSICYREFLNRLPNREDGVCYLDSGLDPQGTPGFMLNFEKMDIQANAAWIRNFIETIEAFYGVTVKVNNWDVVLDGKNAYEPCNRKNLIGFGYNEYFPANKIAWIIINNDENRDRNWFTDCIGNSDLSYSDEWERMERKNRPKKKKNLLKKNNPGVVLESLNESFDNTSYPELQNSGQQIAKFSKVIKTSGNSRNYHNYVLKQLYRRDFIQFYVKNEDLLIRKSIDNSYFDHQKHLYRQISSLTQKDLTDVFFRYVKVTKPAMVYFIVKKRSFLKKRKIFLTSFKLKMIKDFNREGKLFSMVKALYMAGKTRRLRAGLENSTDVFLDKEVYRIGKSDLLRKQKSVYNRSGHEAINDILKKIS